jgi:hypothetical protein
MVLPVPADPATRAGPEKERSTSARCVRVQEDAPLLPWKGQRLLQFLLVGDQANPAQRIGMPEGIGSHRSG